MKVEIIREVVVEPPIKEIVLRLTPEEVVFIRYMADSERTQVAAAARLSRLLPRTGVKYDPDKCFL